MTDASSQKQGSYAEQVLRNHESSNRNTDSARG